MEELKLLLVEDSEDDAVLLRRALRGTPFVLEHVETLAAALERLDRGQLDVVLLDLSLPDSCGLATFLRVVERASREAVIVLTGLDDEELGVRAAQAGAQDYLVKGSAGSALLIRAIRYAVERKRAEELLARHAAELFKKNEEMREDLSLARDVQQAFLPRQYPAFAPSAAGGRTLGLCHRYLPVSAVGGDFVRALKLREDLAGVVMCDVMGHGVRAALVTAMLRVLVHEESPAAREPARMLEHLNHELRAMLRDSDAPLFVSAFYLVLDLRTGELAYGNAGHPAPLCTRAGGGAGDEASACPFQAAEPALGLFDAPGYQTHRCALRPGDRVLLFTDGIYEASGPDGEPYGHARFALAARERAALPGQRALDELLGEVQRFSGRASFDDDVCLLALDYGDGVTRET